MNPSIRSRVCRSIIASLAYSVILSNLLFEKVVAEEGQRSTAPQVFADSLLPTATRTAGTAIAGTALTEGDVKWIAPSKEVVISDHGATLTSPAPNGMHHVIPAVAGTIQLQADVNPKGSGFTGLALGRGDLSGNFWVNLAIMFYVSPSHYDVVVGDKSLNPKSDQALLHGDANNHLELMVDTIARTITARLNGTAILDSAALPPTVELTNITAAGIRYNEPVVANGPSVSNYRAELAMKASTGFEPVNLENFFVAPDKDATLRWHVKSMGPNNNVPYIVRNYEGLQVASGNATLSDDHIVTITRTFPRGYAEINFPEVNQTFGVVSLEPQSGPSDPFFCIDAAMSWLELDAERRAALVKIASRCGISMARERLGLGNVTHAKDSYDWEAGRGFDDIRKMYADSNVPILEILGGWPQYMDGNMGQWAAAWAALATHWQVWGGAEVDNEPDLVPIPADNYVQQTKVISYGLTMAKSKAPVVSGVFATIPPGPFFDTCAANGMLDDCNAVSFHSYDKAPDVAPMVSRYRAWLTKSGKEAMPLWHSECGWHWQRGPGRPPQDQDAASALEISAKGIESMACGITRYFPFVYVYYEEGPNNFGMMGRECTPLRSMAAYATSIQTLSGKKYIGDIEGLDPSVKMARVFANAGGDECVAVLYTGQLNSQTKVPFPIKIKRVTGADGRTLQAADDGFSIPDGMAYVWMKLSDVQANLKTDTFAKRLYEIGQHPLVQERKSSPLVLQFLGEQTPARASARRYLISQETAHAFPLHVRIQNLSQAPIAFTPEVTLPGKPGVKADKVTVPAMGYIDVAWKLDIASSLDIAQTRYVSVCGQSESGIQPSPVALPIVMEGNLEQHLTRHKFQQPLPITELPKWTSNIGAPGKSTFSVTKDGAWRMDVQGAVWTYPKFALPAKVDTQVYSGLLIRARVFKAASSIAIIANSVGAVNFWVSDLFPADGEWHVAYVPFAEFKPGPNGTGDQNSRLNAAIWNELDIGMGSRADDNALEISHLILVGGSDDL